MDGKPYSVRFGRFEADRKRIEWAQLSDLIEDALLPGATLRGFVQSDGIRTEVSVEGMVFEFSPERQKSIDDRNAEAQKRLAPGQVIPIVEPLRKRMKWPFFRKA